MVDCVWSHLLIFLFFAFMTHMKRWCIIHQHQDKPSNSEHFFIRPKTSHLPYSRSLQPVSIVSTQQVNSVTEMGQIHRQADGALTGHTRDTRIHFCFFDIMQIRSDSDSWLPAVLSKCWHSFCSLFPCGWPVLLYFSFCIFQIKLLF